MKARLGKTLFIIFSLVFLLGCESKKTERLWEKSFYLIGSQSSPRVADLNADGVLDIVMGAGKEETISTDHGVIAIDGKSGELLWKQSANDQIVGSATFLDITQDNIPDVFIGGRNRNLKAINGKTGELIWEYQYAYEDDPILKYARYNFYNSVLVPDQNQDGISELLTVNGGNWDAAPDSMNDRYPGVLMLFDPTNGEIIAADTMPDGMESYMSPLCFTQPNESESTLIFGTGGETQSGNLFTAPLSYLLEKRLAKAKKIASEKGHGFIAPPVLADINGDSQLDIIAISHASTVSAIDGANKSLLWQKRFPGTESSNSLTVGHFTNDEVPDIFVVTSKGVWPEYTVAIQTMLDGKDGKVAYQDSIGCFSLASAVAHDLDRDGYDEVIFSTNEYPCGMEFTEDILGPDTIYHQLIVLDFQDSETKLIDNTMGFKNIFSSPWIGDIDKDGYLDIVYCMYFDPKDIRRFMGIKAQRISTAVPIKKAPTWGGYMGTNGNGVFLPEN